ncbi:GA module-containing protein, partial [Enterococcus faecalis]
MTINNKQKKETKSRKVLLWSSVLLTLGTYSATTSSLVAHAEEERNFTTVANEIVPKFPPSPRGVSITGLDTLRSGYFKQPMSTVADINTTVTLNPSADWTLLDKPNLLAVSKYQWYRSTDGKTWEVVPKTEGGESKKLTVTSDKVKTTYYQQHTWWEGRLIGRGGDLYSNVASIEFIVEHPVSKIVVDTPRDYYVNNQLTTEALREGILKGGFDNIQAESIVVQPSVQIIPTNGQGEVKWSIDNPELGTIDPKTGRLVLTNDKTKFGPLTITATVDIGDGKPISGSKTILIGNGIDPSADNQRVVEGDDAKFTISGYDEEWFQDANDPNVKNGYYIQWFKGDPSQKNKGQKIIGETGRTLVLKNVQLTDDFSQYYAQLIVKSNGVKATDVLSEDQASIYTNAGVLTVIPLSEAQKDAIEAIQKLPNLSQVEKDEFVQKVNQTKNGQEIKDVVKEANEKDAQNLANAKKEAKTEINQLVLPKNWQNSFTERIENAETIAEIETIIKEAEERAEAIKVFEEAQKQAIDAINRLKALTNEEGTFNGLTPEEKSQYIEWVKEAKTINQIQNIVVEAIEENTQKILSQVQKDASEKIDKLNLTSKQKTEFKEKVMNAKTVEEALKILEDARNLADPTRKPKMDAKQEINQLPGLTEEEKAGFAKKIDAAKDNKTISTILEEATKLNDTRIEAAINEVNQLKNLTNEEKQAAENKIDEATNLDQINKVVEEMKNLDAARQATRDNAQQELNNLKNLTETENNHFNERLNDAKSVKEINQVVEDARQTDEANHLAKELEAAKKDAQNKINELKDLTTEEKATFGDQVNNGKTVDEVNQIVEEAIKQDDTTRREKEKQFEELKNKGKDKISNEFVDLTPAEKEGFIEQIEALNNPDNDLDALKNIIDQAQQKDEANRLEKQLNEAKNKAKDMINGLDNLDKITKEKLIERINNAQTVDEVNGIRQEALDQDEALRQEKELAKDKIAKELNHLTAEEKKEFITNIDKAQTVEEIQGILTDAETKNLENQEAQKRKELNEAKQKVQEILDGLENLSPEEKDRFEKEIKEATNQEQLEKISNDAKNKDTENFIHQKNNTKDTINNNEHLTDTEKEELKKQVDEAKNSTEVKGIEDKAKKQGEANKAEKEAKELEDAKTKVKDSINNNNDLTESEKDSLAKEVDDSKTIEEVNSVEDKANKQGEANKVEKEAKELEDAKNKVKDSINNNPDLTDAEKDSLVKEVENSKTIDEVNSINDKANKQGEANKAEKEAKELEDAKNKVKDSINNNPDLTDAEKDSLVKEVKNSKTIDEVNSIADKADKQGETNKAEKEAKELEDAKTKVKDSINNNGNLTKTEKDSLTKEVESSKTIDEVTSVEDKANKQGEANKAEKEAKELEDAKNKVKDSINNNPDLTDAEK